jgi:hypothetical protein
MKNFNKKNVLRIKLIIGLIFLLQVRALSQKISLNPQKTFQTMHSFGASDCWSMAMVGKYFPEKKKNQVAEWLFSREMDDKGNPKGIGLSMWRFNIGAGSTEQGEKSQINNEWRRSEGFFGNDSMDWNKQEGQRYFLNMAKKYQVPYTLAFLNSSPVQMTKNGLAIGNGKLGEWNFDQQKIDSWTNFLSQVSSQFEFNYLSPFNEPQWDWGPNKKGTASQEGTPINNNDMAWAIRYLAEKFEQDHLKTKIVIPEAGQIDYLYQKNTNRKKVQQDNQIETFFSPSSSNYVGNLKSVEKLVAGHSYFTTSPESLLVQKRKDLQLEAEKYQVDFWQSEYCILGDNAGEIKGGGVDLGMKTALYVANVIHADLVWANASSWSWWLSVSANDFKDGLIYIFNKDQKGEKDINKLDATLFDSKLLWALGNYSRFVRPKMKRVEVHIDQEKCKISAFIDENQVVLVLVNQGETFQLQLPKLPKTKAIHSFTTSESKNLAFEPVNSKMCQIPNQSIVTFVYEIR